MGRGYAGATHMRLKLAFLLLLLPIFAPAKELYSFRDLSEKETVRMYQSMLLEGCRFGDASWHELPGAADTGYWGQGKSGEDGTRANGGMVLASAALLK